MIGKLHYIEVVQVIRKLLTGILSKVLRLLLVTHDVHMQVVAIFQDQKEKGGCDSIDQNLVKSLRDHDCLRHPYFRAKRELLHRNPA